MVSHFRSRLFLFILFWHLLTPAFHYNIPSNTFKIYHTILITVPGKALSSSTYRNQRQDWGPAFAVDGLWSPEKYKIFVSRKEDFPWLQWHLPMKRNISGVTVSLSNIGTPLGVRNFEVRVGNEPVRPGMNGNILKNELCGKFVGVDDNDRKVYTIMCERNVFVEYVSIQIVEQDVKLAINEVEIIATSEGNILAQDHKLC